MVEDIKAVNRFMSASSKSGNLTSTDSMLDCDYIEYACIISPHNTRPSDLFYLLQRKVPSLTNLPVFSGPSLIAFS